MNPTEILRINSTTRKLGFAKNGQINNVANDLLVFGIGEGGTVSQQNQDYESAIIRLKGKYGNRILKNQFFERVSCSSLYKNKLFGNFGKKGWAMKDEK